MEKSKMKNIVILKNLPSNLIEEAFVIVKSRETAKTLEYIDKKKETDKNEKNPNEYIIREAESVISSYINGVEKKGKKQENLKSVKKNKYLKIYSIVITVLLLGVLIAL